MKRRTLFLAALGSCFVAAFAQTPPQPAGANLLLSLPPPVRRTVLDQSGDETLDAVTRTNTADEPLVFQVHAAGKDGKTRQMSVAADGKLLDKQVFLDELPVPVRKSIQALLAGGKLDDITKNIDDTFTESYVVDMSRGPTNRQFTVDDQGELLEMQVFLSETPPAVQHCIQAKSAGATLGDITQSFDDQDYDVAYDVEMTKAGTTRGFTVSTNGQLLDEQVFLQETPPAVQKSIQAQSKRGRLGDIKKSTEDGETYYQVDVISGRKTVTVTFDAAGAFWGEEEDMLWADLPPDVKRALKPLQGLSQITDINRTTEGANTTYQIQLRDGQKKRSLNFKSNGALIP